MKIQIAAHERGFAYVDGVPAKYLVPGVHRVSAPFKKLDVLRVDTRGLLAELDADHLKLVDPADLTQLTVSAGERGLILRRGKPVKWLGPGTHQVWTVDRVLGKDRAPVQAVSVELIDVSGVATQPLRDELRAVVPASDYVEATAPQGSVVLRYVDGVLDAELPPGRHAAWNVVHKVQLAVIDLRERLLHVTGQEVMTQDRVTLRLNLSAAFKVADAKRLATVARSADEVLYLAMQLAAREAVAAQTLDGLLQTREQISEAIAAEVVRKAAAVGLEVTSFGVKDVVLPGEMKALLNRVIEAQKEAEANVIRRREETAATRSLAQTAKVLGENPLMVRLKELEAYAELATKVGSLHLVLGSNAIPQLQLKGE